ncbi:hypothetical protein M0805_003177 [Coniferiporia weirii]|nr:hypothetical protein M0805_003177 [Coniferiporia weirii]
MSSPASTPPSASSSRSSPSSLGPDDSLLELSFDYELDAEGKLVRVSKGSSKSQTSSPPTPPQTQELPTTTSSSTLLGTSARRSSLSRSESMPGADALMVPARPLARATSGPISLTTPGQLVRSSSLAPLSGGLQGTGRKLGGAQRIRKEEAERQRRDMEDRIRRESEELEREKEREKSRRALEEKENAQVEMRYSPPHASSRPIASLPSRQNYYGFPRVPRPLVSAKKLPGFSKINEVETSEGENDDVDYGKYGQQQQYYQRRSPPETVVESQDPQSYSSNSRSQPQYVPLPTSKSNSSLGISSKARRVTIEERMRQEQEIADEEAFASDRAQADAAANTNSRQSPSPTHVSSQGHYAPAHMRQGHHQRRDSDTLRSGAPIPQFSRRDDLVSDQQQYYEQSQQRSPSARSLSLTATASSTAVNSALASRHRRSPTAPEIPTSSATLVEYSESQVNGKANSIHMQDSNHRAQQHVQQQVADVKTRNLIVNKKPYARLDMIGKGGSSRVYRVMNSANEIYAIKRVSLDKTDTETIHGYMNEIALLKRLEGNNRIIRLIDSEVKGGPGGSKGHLMLVMECGEIDLARLLQEQQKEPMNMIWIAYYWQQILQAVQVIHDEKIVHSDLKPANFVLVKGQLKLIDFGIANAIANDTTNIQRDHQIGTVNYMSPEAIELPEGMRRLKVGRPSDVWSLGCILYQMVYGHPPFQHLSVFQKMKAIPDATHEIEFPETSVPSIPAPRNTQGTTPSPPKRLTHLARPVRRDVIRTIQMCLVRNPKDRSAIPELLEDDWLSMRESTPSAPQQPVPPKLKNDETIINPFYMRQLLQYAIRCAKEGRELSEAEQISEAERLVQELKAIA